MPDSAIILPLALVTLALVLAFAVWNLLRTRRAQRTGARSEMNQPGKPRTGERKPL